MPVARVLAVLQRLPREPEHQAEHDDQCEIKKAGAGETAQLDSPRGLIGVPRLATFRFQRSGMREIPTCRPGSPATLMRSASTAMPGTHARRPRAKTTRRKSAPTRVA